MPEARTTATRAREIAERGFTVFPGLFAPERVEVVARALSDARQRHGEPALYSSEDVRVADGVVVSPVGMAVSGLLGLLPAAADLLLHPELTRLFEAVLGPGFELELVSGILSDHSRPFFFWHNHVGGIDGEDFRRVVHPGFERPERLACTIYATPLDDDHGLMLVQPRAITDPQEPPHPPESEPWPGAVELRAPLGSVLVLEQSTWHAVTPMQRAGRRSFMGAFVRRRGVGPTVREDPSVREALAKNPELARVYGPAC